jgi:hypothetical protein
LRLLHGATALLVLAVGSGKLMNEDWLRQGELQQGDQPRHWAGQIRRHFAKPG